MEKHERKIGKTERILSVYHLLKFCDEVSMRELTQLLPGSKKTFSRDIALLKKSGILIRYSAKRRAFVLDGGKESSEAAKASSRKEEIFLQKLRRLMQMMDEMPDENCDKWYAKSFPLTSKRTMQRDFATMNAIGYRIKYERETFNSHNAGNDLPIRRYYCDRPYSTYELNTFRRDGMQQ